MEDADHMLQIRHDGDALERETSRCGYHSYEPLPGLLSRNPRKQYEFLLLLNQQNTTDVLSPTKTLF